MMVVKDIFSDYHCKILESISEKVKRLFGDYLVN